MQGLRIFSNAKFGELFTIVFPCLSECQWLTLTEAFEYPSDWIDASVFDDSTDRYTAGPIAEFEAQVMRIEKGRVSYGYSSTTNLFPKYARLVSEDWASLFALPTPVPDPLAWLQDYYASSDRATYLSEVCEAVFMNVDGSFWEFYSTSAELIEQYKAHIEGQNIRHELRELRDCADYL